MCMNLQYFFSFLDFGITHAHTSGFPCGLAGKESACSVGDLDSIPRLGRSPGEGNSNPLQYSCLENSMDRGSGQSMELQRVGQDCATDFHFHFHAHNTDP